MVKYNLNTLKTGMILSEAVCNFQDVLLLQKGTELTKENIRILKCWGVNHVYIEGGNSGEDAACKGYDYGIKNTVTKRITDKFSDVLDDEVMVEILKIAEKQALKRYVLKRTSDNETS